MKYILIIIAAVLILTLTVPNLFAEGVDTKIEGTGKNKVEQTQPVVKGLPKGFASKETRKVKVATPKGIQEKEIIYYKNSLGMEFVEIPAGEFMMGSPSNEKDRSREEGPQHKVIITKSFYMASTEVTQKQYRAIMGKHSSKFKGKNKPVEQESWNEAVEFCKKLSQRDGVTYRLPTEAEWEYSCRAGTTTPFYTGNTISTEQANYNGNYTYGNGRKGTYRKKTISVGSYPANAFGLYDMHGNVWEFCQDWYGKYSSATATDASGPRSGSYRVSRGGGWFDDPGGCRSACRAGSTTSYRSSDLGFRLLRIK